MRKTLILCAAMLLGLAATNSVSAKTADEAKLTVMSYNIRMGVADDGTNSWQYRCGATAAMIQDQKPDVFGVQEAFDFQLRFITDFCPDYKCVGVGREDGKSKGEHMSIFYNKKKVKLLKWGTYWLSDTPDTPSKGWDAACYRTATWALMKCKETGKKFYFVNTHLDHKGKEARKNGLALVVSRIGLMNKENLPMVLTGDFNMTIDDPAFSGLGAMMKNARTTATDTDTCPSFNGWGKSESVIDYIFHRGFSECRTFRTINKEYENRKFISDHYPIKAELIF